jgi:signal transduction histidine kinase
MTPGIQCLKQHAMWDRIFPTSDLAAMAPAESRRSAILRLVLAMIALVLILLDPPQTSNFAAISYAVLGSYVAYTAARYVLANRYAALFEAFDIWTRWADVVWFMILLALNHGVSRLFFFGLFFIALLNAFRWGLASDLRYIVAFAIISLFVDVALEPGEGGFELNRLLFHIFHVLLLGYMIVRWGIFEFTLKRRLALLRNATTLRGPQVGFDQAIGRFMAQLRTFYQAEMCLLITADRAADACYMRRVDAETEPGIVNGEELPADLAQRLLAPANGHLVMYNGRPRLWDRLGHLRGMAAGAIETAGDELAELLDAASFLSMPIRHGQETASRIYIIAGRARAFDQSDAQFLSQAVEQFTPILENIRLIDQIAADAAEAERRRIARDIHDSVVQSYIGVQIGLDALHKQVSAGRDVAADIGRLVELVNLEISNVRTYIRGLNDGGGYRDSLLPSVHRFTEKFTAVTGIAVQIEAPDEIQIDDRVAGEVFQMIAEGLSNIRRHTQAKRATIGLARANGTLTLRITNDGACGAAPASFTPRSVTERALALGGFARVEYSGEDHTSVLVDLPV